jgi:DNA-directed RNA polymerase subunit RPC12/RpoP
MTPKKILKNISTKIKVFFSIKCPDCNLPMENVGEYNGSLIYLCSKCLKQWK